MAQGGFVESSALRQFEVLDGSLDLDCCLPCALKYDRLNLEFFSELSCFK